MTTARDFVLAKQINAIARERMTQGGVMSADESEELASLKRLLETVHLELARYREVNAELEDDLKRYQEENAALRADLQAMVDNYKDTAA